MKTLLIMRHAKSSWKNMELDDRDRPLKKRGKIAAPRMGRFIKDEAIVPDVILSSPATRARRTADLVSEACGYSGEIRLVENLYHGMPESYLLVLAGLDEDVETAMVVGHNPGLEMLLSTLTGESRTLVTATLARVALPIRIWSEIEACHNAELAHLQHPKELKPEASPEINPASNEHL